MSAKIDGCRTLPSLSAGQHGVVWLTPFLGECASRAIVSARKVVIVADLPDRGEKQH